MARVVSRQSAPPYLLITFAGLFVAAMIGMVFFWVRSAGSNTRLAELEGNYRRAISLQELSRPDPQLKEMLSKYDRPLKGQPAQTVYAQQVQQIADLSRLVTGETSTAEQAVAKVKAMQTQVGAASDASLAPMTQDLFQRLQQTQQLAEDRGKMLEEATAALNLNRQSLEQLKKDVEARLDEMNQQKLAMEGQIQERHQDLIAQQEQARKDLSQVRTSLNGQISNQVSQIQDLERRLTQSDQSVARLRSELDQRRPQGQALGRQADAKVLEVKEREGICYIDIGSTSKVVPGLTFSVYPSTGVPEDGQGKAQVMVTSVKDAISECRVVSQKAGDPIIPGDLAANIAFNSQRTYSFVIGGEFDLREAGTTSATDLEEVRMMIRRSGGKLSDMIGIDTDFVILGQEPTLPIKPLDSAPAAVWATYNAQLERVNRYQQVIANAKEMHVPILNTNHFLAFIGYPQNVQAQ